MDVEQLNQRDGKNNDMTDLIRYMGVNEFNTVRISQIQECIR